VGGFCLIQHCISNTPLLLQDPAKARLREETSRLNRKIAAGNAEVEALKRRAKAQAKTLAKLKKDLQALQDSRVSVFTTCRAAYKIEVRSSVCCCQLCKALAKLKTKRLQALQDSRVSVCFEACRAACWAQVRLRTAALRVRVA
jgi:hypothetical protein